tara:strand:+ start:1709 stop:3484 length:1776 start_codon:yes stop_codon:yes gene_type:complete
MADPKNKWDQPAAPPPPMFFGKKERDLVKQVNDELSERIIGQPIAYYPISLEESNFNETYGEAIEKVSLPPIRIYAYVVVDNEQANETFGYDYQTKLTVNFSQRRITEDQNVYVRVGDFVQYGDFFYEVVRTYNDTRYYFGQVEHKFQISAECVRARDGAFRVMPAVDRPTDSKIVGAGEASSPAPRPAPYPPLAASYVTVNSESKLPNERVIAAGTGITLTDTGAGGSLTIASTGEAAVGTTGSIQLAAGEGSFYGDATFTYLTASDTLSLTGYITASGHVSSSAFYGTTFSASYTNLVPTSGTLAGLGSYLALDSQNNIIVTSSLGSSTGLGGIFTTINGTQAYVTSSLAIGGTSAPDHQVSISGSVSASVNVSASAFYGDGSSLTNLPAGGLLTALNASSVYLTSSLALGGTTAADHALSISGSVSASVNVSASAFYGNGSNLTGVTASAVEVADGPVGSLQFRVNTPVSGEISGSSKVLYDTTNNNLTVAGGLIHSRTAISTTHTASVGSYILGVTAVPTQILFDATLFSTGQVLVIKDESGAASISNTILLNASASQTIDGVANVTIESPYGSVLLYSNGSNWFIY